jgi:hypothetical protein
VKIIINYEASWRNSFLDPATSNNEPLPKNGRKFVGSMTNLRKDENYISRDVSLDTVMGILNRLVGDQRKLYQARSSEDYYFRDVEEKTKFRDVQESVNTEFAYIRNISGSTDQNSYTGMIKTSEPIFTSDYSIELWAVLAMDLDELYQFILNKESSNKAIELTPLGIMSRLEDLQKLKALPNEDEVLKAHSFLASYFDKFNGLNSKGNVLPISLYCSGLYLQLDRLGEKYKDIGSAKSEAGRLTGISNNGFTKKDFMSRYTTGEKKKIWGNPYMREVYEKVEGKTKKLLTKVNGVLEVNIDIDRTRAEEIKRLIDFAGVSSFYVGKKGLAYVSDIRI